MSLYPKEYPEEYIRGSVHFFGREYRVTPDVLIPRLETECLVRRARKIIESTNLPSYYPTTTVVDIGCGSGIIGTSVADLVDEVIFLDISGEALIIAERNFRTHFPDKKAQFIVSDLLTRFHSSILPSYHPTNLLFLTNLPYIKDADWINMSPDTIHEPKLALFGGEKTGFELYERLFDQLSDLYYPANIPHYHPTIPLSYYPTTRLLCEFGFDQRTIAEKILNQYPNWKYSFFADYAGIERFGEILIADKNRK